MRKMRENLLLKEEGIKERAEEDGGAPSLEMLSKHWASSAWKSVFDVSCNEKAPSPTPAHDVSDIACFLPRSFSKVFSLLSDTLSEVTRIRWITWMLHVLKIIFPFDERLNRSAVKVFPFFPRIMVLFLYTWVVINFGEISRLRYGFVCACCWKRLGVYTVSIFIPCTHRQGWENYW